MTAHEPTRVGRRASTPLTLIAATVATIGGIAIAHAQMDVPRCSLGHFELIDVASRARLLQIVAVGKDLTVPTDLADRFAPGVESWFSERPVQGEQLVLRAIAVGAPPVVSDGIRSQIGAAAPAIHDDIVPAQWRPVTQAPSGASVYTVTRIRDRDGERDSVLRGQFSVSLRYDPLSQRLAVTWYRKVRSDRPWSPFWAADGLREPATGDHVMLYRVDAGAAGFPRTDGTWEVATPRSPRDPISVNPPRQTAGACTAAIPVPEGPPPPPPPF